MPRPGKTFMLKVSWRPFKLSSHEITSLALLLIVILCSKESFCVATGYQQDGLPRNELFETILRFVEQHANLN